MMKKGNRGVVAAVAVAVTGVSLAFGLAEIGQKNKIEPDILVTASVTSAERFVSNGEIGDSVAVQMEEQDASEYASSANSITETQTLVTISPEDLVYDHDTEVQAVINLINQNRQAAGLAPLVRDESLMLVAQTRATEISSYFSHYRPNGTTCFTALDAMSCSYWCAGENIAYGQRHADWVMRDWMNSPSHKDNIMYADYGKVGVGLFEGADGVLYWVQVFTN